MAENAVKQNKVKNSRIFGDYLIMLVAPLVIAVWYYGVRAVYAAAAAVAGAMITDIAANLIIRKQYRLKDLSSVYIGAAIAAMMPAGIPLYIPALAAAFAVLAVKIPFGGGLRAPFSPVAAGFAFACVCFKEQIFDYSYNSVDKLLGSASLGSLLAKGNSVRLNSVNLFDIVSGNVAGPMATGCGIVLIACCAYLFVRRRKALLTTAGFIVPCAVFPENQRLGDNERCAGAFVRLADLCGRIPADRPCDSAEEQRREGDIRGGLRRYLHDDAPPGRL